MKRLKLSGLFLSLCMSAALSILNGPMTNPINTALGIKDAYAQEWPIPKKMDSGCPVIQGKFQNTGEDAPSNDRGSRFPPCLSSDVLGSGWPGKNIVEVAIETSNDATFQFRFIEQAGGISKELAFKPVCQDGWWVFSKTASGGSEGWRGTQTTTIRLAIAEDGSLLTHVVRNTRGKYFYLIPQERSEEFRCRFLKSHRRQEL